MDDSEVDRRDMIRDQIVKKCVSEVHSIIQWNGPANTPEERVALALDVILALMESIRMEARHQMMRQEIEDATKKLEE